jgi:hypothetical protein
MRWSSSGESISSTGAVTDVTQKFSKNPYSIREGAPRAQDTTPYTYPLFFIETWIRVTSYRKLGIRNYREVHFRGQGTRGTTSSGLLFGLAWFRTKYDNYHPNAVTTVRLTV